MHSSAEATPQHADKLDFNASFSKFAPTVAFSYRGILTD